MMDFDTIKGYYERGYWTATMVHKAAEKGVITLEQAEEIVGAK